MIADIYNSSGKKFEYLEGDYLTKFNKAVELVKATLTQQIFFVQTVLSRNGSMLVPKGVAPLWNPCGLCLNYYFF